MKTMTPFLSFAALAAVCTFALPSVAAIWEPPADEIMLQPGGGSSEPWGILNPSGYPIWLPGLELDIPGGNAFNGASLDSYADDGCDCQVWAPLPDPVQSAKQGYSVVGIMSDYAFWYDNLEELCLTATSTTTVSLETCDGAYGQGETWVNPNLTQLWYWKSEKAPCTSCSSSPIGVFEMVNYSNGRCLTVKNGGTGNGTPIVLSICNSPTASQIVWAPESCQPWYQSGGTIDHAICTVDQSIITD